MNCIFTKKHGYKYTTQRRHDMTRHVTFIKNLGHRHESHNDNMFIRIEFVKVYIIFTPKENSESIIYAFFAPLLFFILYYYVLALNTNLTDVLSILVMYNKCPTHLLGSQHPKCVGESKCPTRQTKVYILLSIFTYLES